VSSSGKITYQKVFNYLFKEDTTIDIENYLNAEIITFKKIAGKSDDENWKINY